LGHEVVAFRKFGYTDTIGIDINPGKNNPYVIKGDFHKTKFNNESFDTIYTNSIDHVWNLRIFSKEINRILVFKGKLILEIDHLLKKTKQRRKEWIKKPSKYESLIYDSLNDIKKQLKEFNFIDSFPSAHEGFLIAIFEKK